MINGNVNNGGQLVPSYDPLRWLEPSTNRYLCSWNLDSAEGKKAMIAASQPADFDFGAVAGKVLEITGYIAHVVPVPDRVTGEIVDRPHLVLFTTDNAMIASYSEYTLRSFALLVNQIGNGPFDPPAKVKVNKHPGKKAGWWYTLTPA